MKMFELASGSSIWKGMNYHHENRVISWRDWDKNCFQGEVKGSGDQVYHVMIDPAHPRKSTCDCPFADGRRVICKHMIALYLGIFPEKEEQFMNYVEHQNEVYQLELERERIEQQQKIRKYVMSLSKAELREKLIDLMIADMDDRHRFY